MPAHQKAGSRCLMGLAPTEIGNKQTNTARKKPLRFVVTTLVFCNILTPVAPCNEQGIDISFALFNAKNNVNRQLNFYDVDTTVAVIA